MIIAAALIMAMLAGSYILLQNSAVQTYIIGKITEQFSRKTNAKISVGKVNFSFFNRVVLNDVLIAGPNNDTIFYSGLVSARIDTFKISEHRISFNELSFEENKISITRDSTNRFNFSFIPDSLRNEKKDTSIFWNINCNQFNFQNSDIVFKNQKSVNTRQFFIHQMNLNVSDFSNYADSTSFKINNLTLNYNNYLYINQLSTNVTVTKSKIELDSLSLNSNKSEINDLSLILQVGENETVLNRNMIFDVQLSKSNINLTELAEIIPPFKEIEESIEVSGRIYGNLKDIKGKDLILTTGENTNANFDFYINGVEDIETMYLFLDLKQLETTVSDINNFTIVSNGKEIKKNIPESLYNSGLLNYKGNFSGFLSDFVTFGTLKSSMGVIKTDVSVIPKKDGVYSYRGKITTTDFNLGNLLKTKNIGRISFNGNADGDYQLSNRTISGLFKGEIAKLEAKDYVYRNVILDGY